MTLSPMLTVHEVLRLEPAAFPVFATAGIDTCCGGELTLTAAAQGVGLTFDQLAARLHRGIDDVTSEPAAPSCGCDRRVG